MSRSAELGSALLAKKQARDDKFRKRQESWEKRQAWTELLLPPIVDAGTRAIAESALSKDRELFSSDPDAMAVASSFELANKNTAELLRVKESIDSSGVSPSDYIYNIQSGPFLARAEAELQSRDDGYKAIGEAGPFRATVDKELRILSDEWAEDFKNAMTALQGTGTAEERAARLSEFSRTMNPRRFSDHVFKTAKRVFGRTSKEELNTQAMDDLINSPLVTRTKNFNDFKEKFDASRDIFSAYEMSGLTLPEFSGDGMFLTDTEDVKEIGTDNRLVIATYEIRTHRNTGEETRTPVARENITFDDPNDTPEIRTAKAIKALPNLLDIANEHLNPDALRELLGEAALNENINSYVNPITMSEYNAFAQILETKMSTGDNLIDPTDEALINNFWSTVGTRFIEIDAIIQSLSDDPDEVAAAGARLEMSLVDILKIKNVFSSQTRGISGSSSQFPGTP